VRILKGFKSFVLEVRILQGLRVYFAEVRILKALLSDCLRRCAAPVRLSWGEWEL